MEHFDSMKNNVQLANATTGHCNNFNLLCFPTCKRAKAAKRAFKANPFCLVSEYCCACQTIKLMFRRCCGRRHQIQRGSRFNQTLKIAAGAQTPSSRENEKWQEESGLINWIRHNRIIYSSTFEWSVI
jgi:hypothetical protein